MSIVAFDTLKYARRLEKSGFDREQATELAEVQAEILSELMQETLTSKQDLKACEYHLENKIHELENKIHETKSDLEAKIDHVETRLDHLETKVDRLELRFDQIESRLYEFRAILEDKIAALGTQQVYMMRWMIGIMLSGFGGLAVFMSMIKFFH